MNAKKISLDTRIKTLTGVLEEPEDQKAVRKEIRAAKAVCCRLADLHVGDQSAVMKAITGRPDIQESRDLVMRGVHELTGMIAPGPASGSDESKNARAHAEAINRYAFS